MKKKWKICHGVSNYINAESNMTDFTPKFPPLNIKAPICNFPKHKGEKWSDIVKEDREYVEWILYEANFDLDFVLVEYLEDLLEETEDDD